MNRVLLYIHFNKNEALSEHVLYQLRNIKPLFSRTVFITNSRLSIADKDRLQGLYDDFIQRKNVGFDFAAWRDGMNVIGWDKLTKFDSLTIMNDTCFGPIYPIENLYERMEMTGADFWGITDYAASSTGMALTNGPIPRHVQSYFEVFGNQVIKSEAFRFFWNSVKDHTDVQEVIREYETQLTDILVNAGFSFKVFFDTVEYSMNHNVMDMYNYSELLPVVMLKNGVPLLKVKSFVHTYQWPLLNIIRRTDYPTSLIRDHLKSVGITNTTTVKLHAKRTLAKHAQYIPGYRKVRNATRRKPKA